jgi:hypothetical protein
MNFTHDGHGYFYSGWVDATKDDKVNIYNCYLHFYNCYIHFCKCKKLVTL